MTYEPNTVAISLHAALRQLGLKELANMSGTLGKHTLYPRDRLTRREALACVARHFYNEIGYTENRWYDDEQKAKAKVQREAITPLYLALDEYIKAMPADAGNEEFNFHTYTLRATVTLEIPVTVSVPDEDCANHYLLTAAYNALGGADDREAFLEAISNLHVEPAPLKPMQHKDRFVIKHFGLTDAQWDAMDEDVQDKLDSMYRDMTEKD